MRDADPVLVTGASGFLGSTVVRRLAGTGLRVAGADVRAPAVPVPGVTHHPMDVTDAAAVERVVAQVRPATVVHLAALVTPGRGSSRQREYAVDVEGAEHVLSACLAHGVGRVVVASSGAAYGYHPDNGIAHGGWLTEDDPLRGNEEFAYSHHKRLVEERLAALRTSHPGLEQVVLRIGTILGAAVDNQITALLEARRLVVVRGWESPFVFVWDTDVAAAMVRGVTGDVTGVFNVAGDGVVTPREIAAARGTRTLVLPDRLLRAALAAGHPLRLTPYGPEQTVFLKHRPLLDNTRLKEVLGVTPEKTSRQAFDTWQEGRAR